MILLLKCFLLERFRALESTCLMIHRLGPFRTVVRVHSPFVRRGLSKLVRMAGWQWWGAVGCALDKERIVSWPLSSGRLVVQYRFRTCASRL